MNYKNLFIGTTILLLGVLTVSGMYTTELQNKITEKDSKINNINSSLQNERTKPIVWAGTPTWGETQVNSGNYQFNVYLYNGGSSQAENVNLVCGIYSNNQLDQKVEHNVGNVASESSKEAVFTEKISDIPSETTSACIVTSCEDCFTPRKNINVFRDSFEELIT